MNEITKSIITTRLSFPILVAQSTQLLHKGSRQQSSRRQSKLGTDPAFDSFFGSSHHLLDVFGSDAMIDNGCT